MKKTNTYNHLNEEARGVIRDMLYSGSTARQISGVLGVSHTTITREVKRNRIIKVPNPRNANASLYCKHFCTCTINNICAKCSSPYTYCKKCRKIKCFKACNKFEYIECPDINKWPYICSSNCSKRPNCRFPKSSYAATRAQAKYKNKLISSRSGINMTIKELKQLTESIRPLINKGQSPYAAITALNSININVRTLYRYIEHGIMNIPAIELPRKIRYKKRKSKLVVKDKIDRTGRTYNDYLKLPVRKRDKVFQVDSVEGFKWNKQTLLTLHSPKCKFQFINLLSCGQATDVVKLFDYYEEVLGSRELFEKVFGVILADRGKEFDYFHLIERSIMEVGKTRCRVYFCDPQQPNQKGSAEKNHEHIRCVLPKEHSNFDLLTNFDVAVLSSNINSYPRKSLDGNTPIRRIKRYVPKDFLDTLGIEELLPKNVLLKPDLLKHVQC